MKDVVLNGFIGEKYGRHWNIRANNIGDIFACINANYPSFSKDMIDFAEAGGDISIQLGDTFVGQEEELLFSISPDEVIITPLPAGAKGGAAKLLMAALIVGSLFIPGSQILLSGKFLAGKAALKAGVASAAGGLAVGGVGALNIGGLALLGLASGLAMQGLGQVMAPDPSGDTLEANDEYLFDGPENTVAQNNAVPVLLGEMIVGGVLISTSTTPIGQRYDTRGGTAVQFANQGGELSPPPDPLPSHQQIRRNVR
jgi:predicted phage tail protein